MKPADPDPVKLFCGILFSDEVLLENAAEMLCQKYGSVDHKSKNFPFEITAYYNSEMGTPIDRIFLSFEKLIDPGILPEIKIDCNEIEDKLAVYGKRKINLDPGYLDYDKVVLASAKYNAQKIYLDKGIYADPTLFYRKGKFYPSDHAFPDFKEGIYESVFLEMRAKYKRNIQYRIKDHR
ncbi:MAG: DUF4416 family protein [Candidatus Cloacimonetes bacterium]|nr:DUF4416 family protein [Candidatus Cloacimonadota bacterium]